jgi:hypothetical protein
MKFTALFSRQKILAAAFLLLASGPEVALAQPAVAAAPPSDWSFGLSPYIWVAGVEVKTSLDRVPPATPPEATRFDTKITGGALLEAWAHYRSCGLLIDAVWVRLDTESRAPSPSFSTLDLESNFVHGTVAFSYTVPTQANLRLELLAGARIWSVSEQLTATAGILPGFSADTDETWISPAIGALVRYNLDQKWSVVGQGFVNVFGGQSDGWELAGGVSRRLSQAWSVTFGYRFLREEFSRQRFNFTTDIQGFVLGASYRF